MKLRPILFFFLLVLSSADPTYSSVNVAIQQTDSISYYYQHAVMPKQPQDLSNPCAFF